MKVKFVALVLSLICSNAFCAIDSKLFMPDEKRIVSKFIGDLISDGKAKDSSLIYDVVVLRWEQEVESRLLDEVVNEIGDGNILMMPGVSGTVVDQRIRTASLVIIISDVTDSVRSRITTVDRLIKFLSSFSETSHRAFHRNIRVELLR